MQIFGDSVPHELAVLCVCVCADRRHKRRAYVSMRGHHIYGFKHTPSISLLATLNSGMLCFLWYYFHPCIWPVQRVPRRTSGGSPTIGRGDVDKQHDCAPRRPEGCGPACGECLVKNHVPPLLPPIAHWPDLSAPPSRPPLRLRWYLRKQKDGAGGDAGRVVPGAQSADQRHNPPPSPPADGTFRACRPTP